MSTFANRGLPGRRGRNAPGFLLFGSNTSGVTGAGTRYLWPEFSDSANSTVETSYETPVAFRATSLRFRADSAGTGTGTVTYTLVKNGVATALTITVSPGDVTASGAESVEFAEGDRVAVSVTITGTVNAGQQRPKITIGVEPV